MSLSRPGERGSDRLRSAVARLRAGGVRTVRIARWELTRSVETVDRRTAVALLVVLLLAGSGALVAVDRGIGLEDGIYRAGVVDDGPYAEVAAGSDRFVVVETAPDEFRRGEADVDLLVTSTGELVPADTETGRAAAGAYREAVEDHNEALMSLESDPAAAYPVLVTVEYRPRVSFDGEGTPAGGESTSDGDDGTSAGEESTSDGEGKPAEEESTSDGDDGPSTDDASLGVPDVGGGLEGTDRPNSPGALSPPFPFESLVLAFLFVVPMNVVIQAYGSTILDERIGRRGELLLVSPASPGEIVLGKSLPYALGLVAIVVVIAAAIGGGPISVAATVPLALAFLSATFVGAMLARSFKELTFVTVAISVGLTTYVFVPAVFADVTPIALVSPLTLVVWELSGDPVAIGQYLFSTAPFYLGSAVCVLFGLGLYREEDMFAQKPVPAKALDALSVRLGGYPSVAVLPVLLLPFVFGAQLLAVSLLFVVPEAVALPTLILIAAAIEELAKSVGVYAGFARSRFEPSLGLAAVLGTLSGVGFFLGEKLTHAVQFVGLRELFVGQVVFGPELAGGPALLAALVFAPLVLHVLTAAVAAIGASRGRAGYAVGLCLATLLHAAYNLGVITLVA